MRARFMAWVLDETISYPAMIARRLGVPLAVGACLGLLLAFVVASTGVAGIVLLVIVLAAILVWAVRELRWSRRTMRHAKDELAKWEAMSRDH